MKRIVSALCKVFVLCGAIALPAQTLTTLHSFDRTDGEFPTAELVHKWLFSDLSQQTAKKTH